MDNSLNFDINLPVRSDRDERQTRSESETENNSENPASSCESSSTNTEQAGTSNTKSNLTKDELGTQSNNSTEEPGASGSNTTLDCPICLQPCIHPARLPCGHIFCFLCIKGVANKNQRCAMCRRPIPLEFLDRPQLVNGIEDISKLKCTEDEFQWFYEGRNEGWWAYDKRSSDEIEEVYWKHIKADVVDLHLVPHEMLIGGTIYLIDFVDMVQYPKNAPMRRRKICRAKHLPTKGVAGIQFNRQ